MSSSLHTISQNGTISFIFEGSYIAVGVSYTLINPETMPIVNCIMDNNNIVGINMPQSPQNNWLLCHSGNLPVGSHKLLITIQSQGAPFFFDYFLYDSSEDQPNDVPIRITASDPSISYSGGFVIESDTGSTQLTNAGGAFINISFIGQQLTWYGAYSTFLPHAPSSAEYSIDGGSFKQFPLSGLGSGPNITALLNQVMFQTDVLLQGSHELTARYVGNEQQTALSLAFIVLRNVTSSDLLGASTTQVVVASSSPTLSLSTPTSFLMPSTHTDSDRLIGIIVGAGASFLIIAMTALFLFKRRRKLALRREPKSKPGELPKNEPVGADSPFGPPLHPGRTTQTMQTVTSGSLDGWNGLLVRSRTSAALTSAEPIEALLNSPRFVPVSPMVHPQSLPTLLSPSIFEEGKSIVENPIRLSQVIHTTNDNPTSSPRQRMRPLPIPEIRREAKLMSTNTETTEMLTVCPLSPTDVDEGLEEQDLHIDPQTIEERHDADSGVRLGRQTLIYETNSFTSLKERLPPMYTRN